MRNPYCGRSPWQNVRNIVTNTKCRLQRSTGRCAQTDFCKVASAAAALAPHTVPKPASVATWSSPTLETPPASSTKRTSATECAPKGKAAKRNAHNVLPAMIHQAGCASSYRRPWTILQQALPEVGVQAAFSLTGPRAPKFGIVDVVSGYGWVLVAFLGTQRIAPLQNNAPRAAIITRRASCSNAATAWESSPFCSSTFLAKASALTLEL